jgi:hypothetical protein
VANLLRVDHSLDLVHPKGIRIVSGLAGRRGARHCQGQFHSTASARGRQYLAHKAVASKACGVIVEIGRRDLVVRIAGLAPPRGRYAR